MIDIDAVRADTPACDSVLHFNNAGASLMPRPVFEAVTRHLALEDQIGGYEAQNRASDDLAAFNTEFAHLLNADPGEIAYVENATRAWDMAFYGLPLNAGDRILTHRSEYASNYLAILQQAKRRGLGIDLVPSDNYGQIDVGAIEDSVRPETRLIALTHVPTQGGLVNPAAEVGRVAKKLGLFYMLDACQSVGQMALDVQDIQCDVLSGTGRKFLRGPRGTGFLYVRSSIIDQIDPPFVDLHAAEWTAPNGYELAPGARRFENWESYVAGRVGLMTAVRYARHLGLEAIDERVQTLAATLRGALSSVPGVTVHDLGKKKCGIVTFTLEGVPSEDVAGKLKAQGMNLSVSPMTYARLDFESRGIRDLVRASVHYFNTDDEIDRFCEAVQQI